MAELLVAMVITALASAVIVRSMTFALQFYQARAEDTSAQLLCETVSLLVMDDLTKKSYDNTSSYNIDRTDANGYGKPTDSALALPNACYGYGDKPNASRLVKIDVTSDDQAEKYTITVSVAINEGKTVVAKNEFIVTPVG